MASQKPRLNMSYCLYYITQENKADIKAKNSERGGGQESLFFYCSPYKREDWGVTPRWI